MQKVTKASRAFFIFYLLPARFPKIVKLATLRQCLFLNGNLADRYRKLANENGKIETVSSPKSIYGNIIPLCFLFV